MNPCKAKRILSFFFIINILALCPGLIFISGAHAFEALTPEQESLAKIDCRNAKDLITLGYKYGSGANPFSLQGKCIKLNNIKALQYFDKDKALVEWNYQGQTGVVYLQTRDSSEIFGDSRSVVGVCIGVYSYKTVLGSPSKIPHLIISE
jgi:hypothetical protein